MVASRKTSSVGPPHPLQPLLAPGHELPVVHRQGEPDGEVPGAARRASTPSTCARHNASLTASAPARVADRGREHLEAIPHGGHDVGLVQRAGPADEVAEVLAPTRSQNRAKRSGASAASQPPRSDSHRGMVKWLSVTTGDEAELVARGRTGAGSGRGRRRDHSPSAGSIRLHSTENR